MKKVFCVLLTLALLLLPGCIRETPQTTPSEPTTISTEQTEAAEYLPQDLLGMTPAEIISLFGPDCREVVPEGDPPYFCFDGSSPYWFCGSITDPQILYIKGQEPGSDILPGVHIGSSLEELEDWAEKNTVFTYYPADQWYNEGNGQYGWTFLSGNGYNYSFYIKNDCILSFECRMDVS